jgi:hypothetical protein
MKWVLSWLVRWACRADTRDFCSALVALVGLVQNIFFLTINYFNFCSASWAGSRAGSPVSLCVSLVAHNLDFSLPWRHLACLLVYVHLSDRQLKKMMKILTLM